MTINIRLSNKGDIEAGNAPLLVDLINKVYGEAEGDLWKPSNSGRTYVGEVEEFLSSNKMFLAKKEGKIIGAVKIDHIDDETLAFGMLVADPNIRGEGIGRELVNTVEAHARTNGYKVMQLELLTPRHWKNPSKEFLKIWYDRIGYKPTKTRPFEEISPHRMEEFATDCDFTIWLKAL